MSVNYSAFSDLDIYLFKEGTHYRLFEKFGAKVIEDGVYFAIYAPHANYLSVVGDFNGYDKNAHPLTSLGDSGIWEGVIKEAREGDTYKYFIASHNGQEAYKADPFATFAELKPHSASIIYNVAFKHDEYWVNQRKSIQHANAPISVYEVNLASWKRGEDNRYLSYKELARDLVRYCKKLGYTHIELMPITEYPFDGSWGYQATGYFAPTSRFGTPKDFIYFIEYCHKNGLGVILDWVPSHFATDGHGLIAFDGEALYEHKDPQRGYHPEWKSNIFDYGRAEVRSFLISSAIYWLSKYQIDGIRVDAVASMLYLDYAREEGEWSPNIHGGNENLEAIDFLKALNQAIHAEDKGFISIAEESTAYPNVTTKEGLGFDFKWNMGWMHDSLKYFKKDPIHRQHHHHDLTFMYYYSFAEKFMLPISHDEVVHMKGALINKMPGGYEEKFANLRAFFAFMYAFMGKKLLFMGCEIAQFSEWNYEKGLDWEVMEYKSHQGIQTLIANLNKLYKEQKALHGSDSDKERLLWTNYKDFERNTVVYERFFEDERIVIVANLSGGAHQNYLAPVSQKGKYELIFNSQMVRYGGEDKSRKRVFKSCEKSVGEFEQSIEIDMPALCVKFFKESR